ncbi:LON peptidase substrate-binding domain-containing protein [Nitratireductor basaltis]|uniref:Peptidase S16 lon domain-containing protein n=1 Tax=Nitratireductor basaltis TaxID=472175 RepID=A0A084U6E1_9HYPH|nr:LON peptidase substrate-binding domain-containing protein [Nitratireductor basaltis]KFB08527.1 Peptidase S16 lon domain-containing protein [Nitratireductor basaltis]
MKAGNRLYRSPADLPDVIPVFPLAGALLLPEGLLPLQIFEPRYVEMLDFVLATHRLIGMVQPQITDDQDEVPLRQVGCVGRVTTFSETGDGRYRITLEGISRFTILEEILTDRPFRQCRIEAFPADFTADDTAGSVDRDGLMQAFQDYLEAHDLEADWDGVQRAENAALVNALSMMAPYGPEEKQALLEAPDIRQRADTLVAITEVMLARESGDGNKLQ